MQDFRKLDVWQNARQLTVAVYELTASLPSAEEFALKSQIRRTAVSICANIAEGRGRPGDRAFKHFLGMAMGSASELECELVIAGDLGFVAADHAEPLIQRVANVKRMLAGLMKTLSRQ